MHRSVLAKILRTWITYRQPARTIARMIESGLQAAYAIRDGGARGSAWFKRDRFGLPNPQTRTAFYAFSQPFHNLLENRH